jgi:hypothetical protein
VADNVTPKKGKSQEEGQTPQHAEPVEFAIETGVDSTLPFSTPYSAIEDGT